jgi:hypothetical protein
MQNNLETLHHQAMELVDSFACAGGDRALLSKQQGDVAGGLDLL